MSLLKIFSFILITMAIGFAVRIFYQSSKTRLRRPIDTCIRSILWLSAALTVLITFSVAFILILETVRFFQIESALDFLLGLRWSPSADKGYFGFIPLMVGTIWVTSIAMIVAIPSGLYSAFYMSHYLHSRHRAIIKPLMELLAGIPSVVYGFIALVVVSPFIQEFGSLLGLSIASESALTVGLVIGVMIIPYVASLSDDVLSAIPQAQRDGSLALGATLSESIKYVLFPAALPGVMAAILLAMSRAIGETMVVVMAAGYSAHLTINPLESVTTVTVQIVSQLTGDQEFNSPKTLVAFALGLVLFCITFGINFIALRVIKRYREKYV